MNLKAILLALGLMASSIAVHAAGTNAHWAYTGNADAKHWGDLEQDYAACKLGKAQSPIDIRGTTEAHLAPIGFAYKASTAEVVNNGHTIQVGLAAGGSITLADGEYKLVQFHFHTPSEERINGKSYPLVAHLVHKSEAGKLAVVSVLFKQGKENAALKPVFDHLPGEEGARNVLEAEINPETILPAQRSYYAYAGSLTTPPCSEGVRWQILKTPVDISKAQLAAFRKLYQMNARPVQPLNGRTVQAGG